MDIDKLTTSKLTNAADFILSSIMSGDMKEEKAELINHFASKVYAREVRIPKGMLLVGKIHRYSCINIMLEGDIIIYTENGSKRINKPFISVSPPGTQRGGVALEDTTWICVHGTESTDLKEIEDHFIAKSKNDSLLIKELRRLKGDL